MYRGLGDLPLANESEIHWNGLHDIVYVDTTLLSGDTHVVMTSVGLSTTHVAVFNRRFTVLRTCRTVNASQGPCLSVVHH
jgi:hypothetical protein